MKLVAAMPLMLHSAAVLAVDPYRVNRSDHLIQEALKWYILLRNDSRKSFTQKNVVAKKFT